MRMSQQPLTTVPRKIFERDDKRGIFMCRNTNVADKIYVQFGQPGAPDDFFPILAGDTFTLDRGDLTQEIYLYSDSVNANNHFSVG